MVRATEKSIMGAYHHCGLKQVTIFTHSPAIRHYSRRRFYVILMVDYNSAVAFLLVDIPLHTQESRITGRGPFPPSVPSQLRNARTISHSHRRFSRWQLEEL